MKIFFAFVSKEFKHIFRDKRTLIILFGMPIALVILFGFAVTTEINNAKIQVVDLVNDVTSQKLINKIKASGYFSVYENTKSVNDIERIFQDGKVKLAVVIPQNFSKDLVNNNYTQIQIIADATDPNTSNIITSYLSAVFVQFEMEEGYAINTNLEINTRMKYNPLNKSVYMFVPGVMTIILMLVSSNDDINYCSP